MSIHNTDISSQSATHPPCVEGIDSAFMADFCIDDRLEVTEPYLEVQRQSWIRHDNEIKAAEDSESILQ